jgi:RNA polymerase sigma-70 factor (ECF subfamily)
MIGRAASGDAASREDFARRYLPAVRAYLGARWGATPLRDEVEDASQEVFVECFRDGGALARLDPTRAGGFRAFLYGVARNVARRAEERNGRRAERRAPSDFDLDAHEGPADTPSRAFDREWARSVLREAAARQAARARSDGERALRRLDLLRLRFQEGVPIREIAARWGAEPTHLHHEYAAARAEFRAALADVVAEQNPGAEVEGEVRRLFDALAGA